MGYQNNVQYNNSSARLSSGIKWEQEGKNLVVYLPQLTFSEMPCEYAWTLKITNIQ